MDTLLYSNTTGTIISDTYGIARGATAIAVRVLGASGGGTTGYIDNNRNPSLLYMQALLCDI